MFANITTYKIILLTYLRLVMSRAVNATVLSVVVNFSQSSHHINKRSELCPSLLFVIFSEENCEKSLIRPDVKLDQRR